MGVDKLKIHLISVFLKLPHICKIDKTPSKLACRQHDLQKRLYIEIMLSHDQKIYINLDRYGEQTLLLWTIPNLITASVFHIHLILNIASCFYNHENASWRFLYCSIWSIPLDSTTHIYCQLRIEQSRSFRLALLKIGHARNKTKTKLSCHL